MFEELAVRGGAIRLHDIGGTIGTKVRGVLGAMLAILTTGKRTDRAYLSVPGQAGVWLFVPLALLLRLRGIVHVIHHHSFRPINLGPARNMRMLVAAGGARQRHVLLSANMKDRFADLYLAGHDDRAMTLSNAYLFGPQLINALRPDRPITLGHMSVLTQEKGVAYLLDVFSVLAAREHEWRLVIAGPCADPVLRDALTAAVTGHCGRVEYRGAIEGVEKERFFADVDLFVLPTTLIDEAEPLVMLEAYGRGIDVVANDTGCIRDRIRTCAHLLTRDREADATLIEAVIGAAARDWATNRQACVDHAGAIKVLADAEAAAFFPQLLDYDAEFAIHAKPVT